MSTRAPSKENVADRHDLLRLSRNSLEAESGADDTFVHRAAFRERWLLAVVGDRNIERSRVLERRAHEMRAHDRLAIIAHRDRARGDHLADPRERIAALADRDCADWVDTSRVRDGRLARDEADGGLIVRY